MNFLEKNLESIIWENMQTDEGVDKLMKRGLFIPKSTRVFKQLKIGNYGVADIVSFQRLSFIIGGQLKQYLSITVFELKKEKIDCKSFAQASRYCNGISNYLISNGFYNHIQFQIVLIGSQISDQSDLTFIPDVVRSDKLNLNLFTYSYKADGIYFESHDCYREKYSFFE